MANKPDTWMPWFIGDYLADTMHLTTAQHGGYDLLLMAYWRNGGPLPDDDVHLASIAKASPGEWRKLKPVLVRFFRVEDGYWHQKRSDAELEAAARRQGRASAGGRGKAEAKQPTSSPQAGGEHVLEACSTGAPLPSPLPLPKSLYPEEGSKEASQVAKPAGTRPVGGTDWTDPENRKARHRQKVFDAIKADFSGGDASEIIEGFMAGNTGAAAVFEKYSSRIRGRH